MSPPLQAPPEPDSSVTKYFFLPINVLGVKTDAAPTSRLKLLNGINNKVRKQKIKKPIAFI
jgi:hypothetical protein